MADVAGGVLSSSEKHFQEELGISCDVIESRISVQCSPDFPPPGFQYTLEQVSVAPSWRTSVCGACARRVAQLTFLAVK